MRMRDDPKSGRDIVEPIRDPIDLGAGVFADMQKMDDLTPVQGACACPAKSSQGSDAGNNQAGLRP
ncbi:MAG: hypothetical protein ACC646_03945 [Paracoccaceae bacterium]